MQSERKKISREVPNQNFQRIKRNILCKAREGGKVAFTDLFQDISFPPDLSSLSYVYSGNDHYERMKFRRPMNICENAIFAGVGGILESPFPHVDYRKRKWFEAAVVAVSLCVRYLEKIIHGYRTCDQNFALDYVGAFHFNIWRFGNWVEVVVDDNLPVYCDQLFYCNSFGTPNEFWGPLLEKAYAKIMQTYESIEYGNTVDALTDLTGGICELYNPDVNPPENLFHVLYKSSVNRSFMVCWRNGKIPTSVGFYLSDSDENVTLQKDEYHSNQCKDKEERFLHVITCVTKFPVQGGRFVEMVRLKCPFRKEPKWNGKYSDGDMLSWNLLNPTFVAKYRPVFSKGCDEYWMTLEDFRCNFAGLIICSTEDPCVLEGLHVDRAYSCHKKEGVHHFVGGRYSSPAMLHERKNKIKNFVPEIIVKENTKTVKVDSTAPIVRMLSVENDNALSDCSKDTIVKMLIPRGSLGPSCKQGEKDVVDVSHLSRVRAKSLATRQQLGEIENWLGRLKNDNSVSSLISGKESPFSASDISIDLRSREDSLSSMRNHLGPPLPVRKFSTGSLSHLTQSNFLATKTDCFRAHGSWRMLISHEDTWKKCMTMGSRFDLDVNSKNPRVCFSIMKADQGNEYSSTLYNGKSHVIISLLQDYRHGPATANSLLFPIGFCVYKGKDKDDKHPLSKLMLVGQVETVQASREVNARFDLDVGNYVVVPYCLNKGHEGRFLVRVLGARDAVAGKTGCTVS